MEVVKFLRAVAYAVLTLGKPVTLDFRGTMAFYVSATILLYSEIDRIIATSDLPKPVTILDPRTRRPREVLKQIGLYHLTGDTCDIVPERDDVVYWKAVKGASQSGDQLQAIEGIAERVNRAHIKQLEISGIWRGLTEAVANTVDHAYQHPRSDGFQGLPDTKWWLFTQVRDPYFTAAVCDLGCGYRATIGQTIPEKMIAALVAKFGGRNLDAQAIFVAMEHGRSGTKKAHRGRGLGDVLSVIEHHGAGELAVVSNTGWMKYQYRGGVVQHHDSGSLGIDIRGTIVWWRLPLTEVDRDES